MKEERQQKKKDQQPSLNPCSCNTMGEERSVTCFETRMAEIRVRA